VFGSGLWEAALAAFAFLYHWQSILLHSNIRIRFGPLRWLIASPDFHHWHHSNEVAAHDKNFAGQLALLDVLFGTAHMPHGQVPSQYGIDESLPPTYLSQLLHPFRNLASLRKADLRARESKQGRPNDSYAPATHLRGLRYGYRVTLPSSENQAGGSSAGQFAAVPDRHGGLCRFASSEPQAQGAGARRSSHARDVRSP